MINTFWPGSTFPRSRRPWRAVKPETPTTAACSNESVAGLDASLLSGARAYSAKVPLPMPNTSSPAWKLRDVAADGLHDAGHVRTEDGVLRRAQPVAGEPYRVRQAGHDVPDAPIHAGRVDAYEHVVVGDLGHVDVPQLQAVGGAVGVADDRLHAG